MQRPAMGAGGDLGVLGDCQGPVRPQRVRPAVPRHRPLLGTSCVSSLTFSSGGERFTPCPTTILPWGTTSRSSCREGSLSQKPWLEVTTDLPCVTTTFCRRHRSRPSAPAMESPEGHHLLCAPHLPENQCPSIPHGSTPGSAIKHRHRGAPKAGWTAHVPLPAPLLPQPVLSLPNL